MSFALPPGVKGKSRLILQLQVTKLLLTQQTSATFPLTVSFRWWGELSTHRIHEADITQNAAIVKYAIKCGRDKFTRYLQDMQDLVIEVRNGINDQILGLARVSDIHTQLVDTGVDEKVLPVYAAALIVKTPHKKIGELSLNWSLTDFNEPTMRTEYPVPTTHYQPLIEEDNSENQAPNSNSRNISKTEQISALRKKAQRFTQMLDEAMNETQDLYNGQVSPSDDLFDGDAEELVVHHQHSQSLHNIMNVIRDDIRDFGVHGTSDFSTSAVTEHIIDKNDLMAKFGVHGVSDFSTSAVTEHIIDKNDLMEMFGGRKRLSINIHFVHFTHLNITDNASMNVKVRLPTKNQEGYQLNIPKISNVCRKIPISKRLNVPLVFNGTMVMEWTSGSILFEVEINSAKYRFNAVTGVQGADTLNPGRRLLELFKVSNNSDIEDAWEHHDNSQMCGWISVDVSLIADVENETVAARETSSASTLKFPVQYLSLTIENFRGLSGCKEGQKVYARLRVPYDPKAHVESQRIILSPEGTGDFDIIYNVPVLPSFVDLYGDSPAVVEVWSDEHGVLGFLKLPAHHLISALPQHLLSGPQNSQKLVIPKSEYCIVDLISGEARGWVQCGISIGDTPISKQSPHSTIATSVAGLYEESKGAVLEFSIDRACGLKTALAAAGIMGEAKVQARIEITAPSDIRPLLLSTESIASFTPVWRLNEKIQLPIGQNLEDLDIEGSLWCTEADHSVQIGTFKVENGNQSDWTEIRDRTGNSVGYISCGFKSPSKPESSHQLSDTVGDVDISVTSKGLLKDKVDNPKLLWKLQSGTDDGASHAGWRILDNLDCITLDATQLKSFATSKVLVQVACDRPGKQEYLGTAAFALTSAPLRMLEQRQEFSTRGIFPVINAKAKELSGLMLDLEVTVRPSVKEVAPILIKEEVRYVPLHVYVSEAMHLPTVMKTENVSNDDPHQMTAPSVYAKFEWRLIDGSIVNFVSIVSSPSTSPRIEWKACIDQAAIQGAFHSWKGLSLAVTLHHSQNGTIQDKDPCLGAATINLTPLAFGMGAVDGWYSVKDSRKSAGTLKVRVQLMDTYLAISDQVAQRSPHKKIVTSVDLLKKAVDDKFFRKSQFTAHLHESRGYRKSNAPKGPAKNVTAFSEVYEDDVTLKLEDLELGEDVLSPGEVKPGDGMTTLSPQAARDSQVSVATLINPASTYFRAPGHQTPELFNAPNVEEIVVEKDIPNVDETQELETSAGKEEETRAVKVMSLLSPLDPPLGVGVLSTEEVQRIRRIFSGLAPLPSLRSTSLDQ